MVVRFSSTRTKVFAANLLLFLILSVFLFANNVHFKNYNEKRLTERLEETVAYVQAWFDESVRSIFDLVYRMRNEDDVILASVSLRQDRSYFDRLSHIMNRLSVLRTDVSVIEDAYLFFGNFDRVVSYDGTRDYDVYRRARQQRAGAFFAKESLSSMPHHGTVVFDVDEMIIVAPLGTGSAAIAEVSGAEVRARLGSLTSIPGSLLVIHHDNTPIFWSSGSLERFHERNPPSLADASLGRIQRASREIGVTYSALYDPALLQRQLRVVNMYTVLFFAFILAFNVGVAVYYQRTFAPLDSLLERMGRPSEPENDLLLIDREFSRMQQSNNLLRAELEQQQQSRIEVLLSRAVQYGQSVVIAEFLRTGSDAGDSDDPNPDARSPVERRPKLVGVVLSLVCADGSAAGTLSQLEDDLAATCWLARIPVRSEVHSYLLVVNSLSVGHLLDRVRRSLRASYARWYAGVSSPAEVTEPIDLRSLHAKSVAAFEGLPATDGYGSTVALEEPGRNTEPRDTGLTLSDETMIIDAFTAGDVDAVARRVASILDPDGRTVGELRRRIMHMDTLLGVILRSRGVGTMELEAERPQADGYRLRDNAKTVVAVFTEAARVCAGRDRSLLDAIYEYIAAHYADGIGTSEVARGLGMSPGYISSYFHRLTGERLIHYINSVCVDRGADLLISVPTLSVAEVAQSVGMPNPNTFIRNFKRYKGCTPGEYRHTAASR